MKVTIICNKATVISNKLRYKVTITRKTWHAIVRARVTKYSNAESNIDTFYTFMANQPTNGFACLVTK